VYWQIAAEALVCLHLAAGNSHQYLEADWQQHTAADSVVTY